MTSLIRAHAKVNLALAVGQRQADGFHQLVSVMTRLELADELTIRLQQTPSTNIVVRALDLPDGDTLVTSAIDQFLAHAGISATVEVELTKRIPHGAGLGGGSSDAGAILVSLSTQFPDAVTREHLHSIAAAVGSDVPFFLEPGSALIGGRGDQVTPIQLPELAGLPVTVLWPRVTLSTPRVFGALEHRREILPSDSEILERVRHQDWFNDLARPARAVCPELNAICLVLDQLGMRYLVAGSGSSVVVFGEHAAVWDEFPDEIRNKDTIWVAQTRLVT